MEIIAAILSLIAFGNTLFYFFGLHKTKSETYWKVQTFLWNVVACILWYLVEGQK
jgi:hypothetical protein